MKKHVFQTSNSVGHIELADNEELVENEPNEGLYPAGIEMKDTEEEIPGGVRHIAVDDQNSSKQEGYYPAGLKMEDK
jgi:hypothetical protein